MKFLGVVTIILIIISHSQTIRLKLTNLKCSCTEKTFCTFEICRVKAVSRNLQYFQVYLKFHQLPITKMETRLRFMKRANGYKPFLYDLTLKCDFLKHLNPITSIVWAWFREASNLNHSCPFVEDFTLPRLENIYLQKQLNALPVPEGDYAFFTYMNVNNKTMFEAQFYATVS